MSLPFVEMQSAARRLPVKVPQGTTHISAGDFYKFTPTKLFYWNTFDWIESKIGLKKFWLDNPEAVNDLPKIPKTSVEFLDKSKQLQVERGQQYDSEERERSFAAVATMFTAATGIELNAAHVALIQCHLKQVRAYANTSKPHQDSLEDAVSYTSLWAEEFLKQFN